MGFRNFIQDFKYTSEPFCAEAQEAVNQRLFVPNSNLDVSENLNPASRMSSMDLQWMDLVAGHLERDMCHAVRLHPERLCPSLKTNVPYQPLYTHYHVDNNHIRLKCGTADYLVIYGFKMPSSITHDHHMDVYSVVASVAAAPACNRL